MINKECLTAREKYSVYPLSKSLRSLFCDSNIVIATLRKENLPIFYDAFTVTLKKIKGNTPVFRGAVLYISESKKIPLEFILNNITKEILLYYVKERTYINKHLDEKEKPCQNNAVIEFEEKIEKQTQRFVETTKKYILELVKEPENNKGRIQL